MQQFRTCVMNKYYLHSLYMLTMQKAVTSIWCMLLDDSILYMKSLFYLHAYNIEENNEETAFNWMISGELEFKILIFDLNIYAFGEH